ncbi:hypothetical protein BKA62DRAFT_705613 [Auriculariales sp. MPI-PUGE-AT-0066]|nr:hypothetical protein BKA62DRAFT_705613 [Auriculariales sp. MPI-PUGE-AT-0066]
MVFHLVVPFFTDLFTFIGWAYAPTLAALRDDPTLLLQPLTLRRVAFAAIWTKLSEHVDENARPTKQKLVTPHAYGTVLEIGAGFGVTMRYLDRTKVIKYIAVEPNPGMHVHIRRVAAEVGFSEYDGTLEILPVFADQIGTVLERHSIDTLISILTLCSIPRAESILPGLVQYAIKPGGQFLTYEHVNNPIPSVYFLQRLLSPLWSSLLDGCTIGLPCHVWVDRADDWEVREVFDKDDETPDNLFIHKAGRFVRRKSSERLY